jgi:hypothetical protein
MVASRLCGSAAVASIGYEPWQETAPAEEYPFNGDDRSVTSISNPVTGNWTDAFDAFIAALPSTRLP